MTINQPPTETTGAPAVAQPGQPPSAQGATTPAVKEITWPAAAGGGLVAGVICGIGFALSGDNQKGRMIAFAITFLPVVGAIKPVAKKALGIVTFFVGAVIVAAFAALVLK